MIPIHQCGTVPPYERIARVTRNLFAACLFLAAPIALAIQPVAPDQGIPTAKLQHAINATDIDVQPELEAATSLTGSTRAEATAFQQRHGGTWEMRWDTRGDRPNLIQGSGVPLVPGKGNSLTLAQMGLPANETVDLAVVEARLQDFIAANASLLETKGLDFALDQASSVPYGKGNSHWFIEFAQVKDGIRVEGANLFFRIAAGNIIQFGANRVAPVTIDVQPASTRAAAFDLALHELDFAPDTRVTDVVEAGELLIVPVSPAGESYGTAYSGAIGRGYDHRLVWRFVFRVADDPATYQVLLDAKSNRVIDAHDINDYVNATVTGGVFPTTNTDPLWPPERNA